MAIGTETAKEVGSRDAPRAPPSKVKKIARSITNAHPFELIQKRGNFVRSCRTYLRAEILSSIIFRCFNYIGQLANSKYQSGNNF